MTNDNRLGYRFVMLELVSMITNDNRIGYRITMLRFGSWFELDWTGRPNHSMAMHHALRKSGRDTRYPFKGSFLPCLILNKYEVSFFRVFALRNATEKASENCLNESIVPGISLRYHYRAVPVLISVLEAIIRGYDWHFKSSRVRRSHECWGERRVETDSLQYARVLDWVTLKWRLLKCSQARLLGLLTDRHHPAGEDSSASSSRGMEVLARCACIGLVECLENRSGKGSSTPG
ncbi:hypothetical protein TIFTF001_029210 [Ficus carica]|uniref:Uncharacterized protein n=1 Tax=Ficus carica TaxID=3494 RepID=A0AA88DRF1_FICCA|nr:hypothetical protein TIFTF001_029210 [Ficus carica]